MKITKNTLRKLIKEELDIFLEAVDPTADPDVVQPSSPEKEKEAEIAKKAAEAPLVKKTEKTIAPIRSPEEYAEILKNVLLGTRLSPTKKREAVMKVFGDKMGLKIWSVLTTAAPAIKE